jgi:hypothetical protein
MSLDQDSVLVMSQAHHGDPHLKDYLAAGIRRGVNTPMPIIAIFFSNMQLLDRTHTVARICASIPASCSDTRLPTANVLDLVVWRRDSSTA